MQKNKYDLIVIGGGPGGYTAAILAAKKGLKVVLADSGGLGGTCTNRGCIPTKTYIESIKLINQIKNASKFGIEAQTKPLSLQSLAKRKNRVVSRLSKGIEYLLKVNGIEYAKSGAAICDAGTVEIGDIVHEGSSIIIASGSRPKPCPFKIDGIWSSDDALNAEEIPETLLIAGGGVIGIEMAYIFSSLGSKVTVVEAMDRILPAEEPDVSNLLARTMRNVRFVTSARILDISLNNDYTTTLALKDGLETLDASKVLWCTGRSPVVPSGADKIGIKKNSAGGISVDEKMRTSVPGIYAVGDVTGEWMLAYTASKEAEVAVHNITGSSETMDYSCIPSIVFANSEIASVGIGFKETAGMKKGTFPVSALGRARTAEENEGFANVYVDENERIRRVAIAGPHATDLIAWACLAIKKGMTAHDFLKPAYTHPTYSEILKEAVEDALGISVHKG